MSNPLAHTAVALAVLALSSSAHAQQSPDAAAAGKAVALDKVEITGSRISMKQSQLAGVGPVTVIDAESIQRSGAISAETLLQRLPASAGTAGSQTSAYWTSNGYGTTQVNLRGLGINRTLVLLNGRRVVNGGTGANSSVDLNMIPVALIERVEVLKDGASAIYGADAVAGVVNIITKKRLNGIETGIRYGQTSRGDGDETAVDFAWGLSGDKGSLITAINYSESGEVNMGSRAPCGLGEVAGALVCVGSSSTIGGRARLAEARAGDMLGEMSVLDAGSRFSACTTLTPCVVAVLDAQRLDEMMAAEPRLAMALLASLARRLSLRLRQVSARLSALLSGG